jgi:hypothetical protein
MCKWKMEYAKGMMRLLPKAWQDDWVLAAVCPDQISPGVIPSDELDWHRDLNLTIARHP